LRPLGCARAIALQHEMIITTPIVRNNLRRASERRVR
jgi:hypothetical protein